MKFGNFNEFRWKTIKNIEFCNFTFKNFEAL